MRKCFDNDICDNFQDYFVLKQHKTETKNVECLIKLPDYKTEYAMKSFCFMGAKTYNNLPIELRKTDSFKQFEELLKKHLF